MKKTISYLIILLILDCILFTGCQKLTLSHEEARLVICESFGLPARYRHDIDKRPTMGSEFELDGLKDAGLIRWVGYLDVNTPIYIEITEEGKSSFMGENQEAYMFKTHDIDFGEILGISINENDKTAVVRFSVKATNVTPAGIALSKTNAGFSGRKYINYSLSDPINGEVTFKKFDNGWQLLTEPNKTKSELLNELLINSR